MLNGLDLFSGIGGISIALSDWVKTTIIIPLLGELIKIPTEHKVGAIIKMNYVARSGHKNKTNIYKKDPNDPNIRSQTPHIRISF